MTDDRDPTDVPSTSIPILVGRDREQALLRNALDGMLRGDGRLVLIGGEAGIGKSALVSWLTGTAARHGASILVGGCYDLTTTPPYGPWIEIASQYPVVAGGPLIPAVLRRGDTLTTSMSHASVLADVREFFTAASHVRPTIVVIEDLHWADAASLELLRVIARRVSDLPLLLVATYRNDDVTAEHPLASLLPLLIRESGAERIDVRAFTGDDVGELIRRQYALSASDVDRLVTYLMAHTEGNPLYLGELLRTLVEDGQLQPTIDGWMLHNLGAVVVPRLIRQVIDGRVMRLDEPTRRLLTIAAVIGQDVPLDVWSAASSVADEELLDVVERAVAARFIAASDDGQRVRFVHALIREALYASILPPRRRTLHRQIAEQLTTVAHADPDIIAHHFQQAGDSRAASWLIRAGEAAERAYAWTTAAERFTAALPLLESDPAATRLRGWLLLHLGRLLRYAAARDSVRFLEAAGHLADEIGDRALAALALAHAGMVRGFLWDAQRGTVELEAGVAAQDQLTAQEWAEAYQLQRSLLDPLPHDLDLDDPKDLEIATITSQQTGLLVRQLPLVTLRYLDAVVLGEAYVRRVEAVDAAALLRHTSALEGASWIDAYTGFGETCAILGQVDAALRACTTAEALYRAAGHHASIVFMAAQCAWLIELPYQADNPVGRAYWQGVADASERHTEGIYSAGWLPGMTRLPMLVLEGAWATAREVAVNMIAHQPAAMAIMAEVALGTMALAQGDRETASAIVRQRLPRGPESDPAGTAAGGVFHLARLAATVALEGTDFAVARRWLEAHDRWLEASGRVLGLAESQLLWARLDARLGAWMQAEEAALAALAYANDPRQPLALMAVYRLLGEIATRRRNTEQAAQHLQMSLALADACAAPYERALTLLALAELRASEGALDETRVLADEVRSICELLGARPALARVDALVERLDKTPATYPAGLTAREVDVLRLVADGLPDAEIAERLFISRRTVNTHLTSIYTKLGVNSRAAATRFAVERGLT